MRHLFFVRSKYSFMKIRPKHCCLKIYCLSLSSQNATALAAATFRESTPWNMGIITV